MIIDGHVHVDHQTWRKGIEYFAPVIDAAKESGIDKLCVFPGGNMVGEDIIRANDQVMALMERYPDQVIGFCYVAPTDTDKALKELQRCLIENSMCGLKLLLQCKTTDPRMDPIMELVTDLGVPVIQHAWDKVTGNLEFESTPYEVADLARRHPKAKIIMAHLYGARFKGILDIAPYKNLYVDVSGGNPEAGVLEFAVQVLGPERIIYGTDFPIRDFPVQLSKVFGADISDNAKDLILGGNMQRLLG